MCPYNSDDILVLTPTRWKLRKAVKILNQVLDSLKVQKHPDKTFIGRVEKGFAFLGYRFGPEGLGVARKTIEKFVVRMRQLYEQRLETTGDVSQLATYVRHWWKWVNAGFDKIDHVSVNMFAHDLLILTCCHLFINPASQ